MFLQNFQSVDDVLREFDITASALESAEILLAWYGYGSYCGSAEVLFRKDGELLRVTGGHCSCYALEGQWSPDRTTWAALAKEFKDREPYEYEGAHEFINAMRELIAKNFQTNQAS